MKKKLLIGAGVIALLLAIIVGKIFAPGYQGGTASGQPEEQAPKGQETNYLILGIDARENLNGRTDTIMLANVDPNTQQITLLSIPRDTRVMLRGSYDRINAAYVYGGIDMCEQAVEDLLDIKIDHYVLVDFKGFEKLVDLVGGVPADVPQRMYVPLEGIDLQPGQQTLDGHDALAFARFRYSTNGDLDRAEHQQEILKALFDEVFQVSSIPKIPQMIGIAMDYVQTDLTNTEMLKLAAQANSLRKMTISGSVLPGDIVKLDGLWYYLNDTQGTEEAAAVFKKDDSTVKTTGESAQNDEQ